MPRHGELSITAIGQRPDPPENLPATAAAIWRDVVGSMPAGFFTPECVAMLRRYALHIHECERLDAVIEGVWARGEPEPMDIQRWLNMRAQEWKSAGDIATKLRLTPQAKYDKNKRLPSSPSGAKPWEFQA